MIVLVNSNAVSSKTPLLNMHIEQWVDLSSNRYLFKFNKSQSLLKLLIKKVN